MKHHEIEKIINVKGFLRITDLWEIIENSLCHKIMSFTSISIHFRTCFTVFEWGCAECRISSANLLLTSCSSVSSLKLSNLSAVWKKKMLQGVSLLSLKVLAKMLGFSLYASVSNHSASVWPRLSWRSNTDSALICLFVVDHPLRVLTASSPSLLLPREELEEHHSSFFSRYPCVCI